MNMKSNIEQHVMASVGTIYIWRRLTSMTALKLYALAASGIALWQFTWVHRVFENWARVGVDGTWTFVTHAVLNTGLPVKLALIVAAATGISLMIEAIQTLRQQRPSLLLQQ